MTDAVTPTSGGGSTTSGTEGTAGTASQRDTTSTSSTFSNMDELRRKEPKLYQVMMEGIAMSIINRMKRQQDHLKDIMRDARRSAGLK